MIPKIIHQIWIGPKPPPMDLINTVIYHNPDYKHILWTEKRIEQNKHLFRNYEKYHLIKPPAYNTKSDVLRYEIVYQFGGFYVDADFKFLKGIGNFFINHEFCAFRENNRLFGDSIYVSGLFGAVPKHPILNRANENIRAINDSEFLTYKREKSSQYFGPRFITKHIKNYINENPHLLNGNPPPFKAYSSHYFFPYYIDGKPTFYESEKELDHIFAHHLWKNGVYNH